MTNAAGTENGSSGTWHRGARNAQARPSRRRNSIAVVGMTAVAALGVSTAAVAAPYLTAAPDRPSDALPAWALAAESLPAPSDTDAPLDAGGAVALDAAAPAAGLAALPAAVQAEDLAQLPSLGSFSSDPENPPPPVPQPAAAPVPQPAAAPVPADPPVSAPPAAPAPPANRPDSAENDRPATRKPNTADRPAGDAGENEPAKGAIPKPAERPDIGTTENNGPKPTAPLTPHRPPNASHAAPNCGQGGNIRTDVRTGPAGNMIGARVTGLPKSCAGRKILLRVDRKSAGTVEVSATAKDGTVDFTLPHPVRPSEVKGMRLVPSRV